MFRYVGLYTASAATCFYLIYLGIGRRLEAKLAIEVERQRLELEGKDSKQNKFEEIIQNYVPGVQLSDNFNLTAL